MGVFKLIKAGVAARGAFRNWRSRKRNLELAGEVKPMLKGKLTYTALAVTALVTLAQWLDVPLAQDEAGVVVQAIAVLVGVFGRWRASR